MSITLLQLCQEFSYRLNELILSSPTTPATTAVMLQDAALPQWLPSSLGLNNERFMPFVYGTPTADTLNRGVERRASQYQVTGGQMTFPYAWPANITTGSYEIHLRSSRSRKVAALNDAVGQLGLSFVRPFVDTSITTQTNVWAYTVPSSINLARLYSIEVQLNQTTSMPSFPYDDGNRWNWTLRRDVTALGVETFIIQFGTLPPPDRILRLIGESYVPALTADTDVLPTAGAWDYPARTWIYQWAAYQYWEWMANNMPANEADRYDKASLESLKKSKDDLMALMPGRKYMRLVTPGRGDGQYNYSSSLDSPGYLAGLHGAGN